MKTGVLVLIALGGLALRLIALLGPGGPLAAPTGYDDGVYYAASALLFDGVLPYRDFTFVHPPGVLYFYGLAPTFAVARVLAALVGAVNVFLTGRIVMRAAGPFGGILAAVLYATYPEAVNAERTVYLEPVLNLACLALAYVWLKNDARRPVLAGVLLGIACSMKVLGGIWLLAALASTPRRQDAWKLIGAAAVTGLLLLAPLALPNLPGFIEQTLMFHSWRPPDGILEPAERLRLMFGSGHTAASVLALLTLAGMLPAFKRLTREERFFGVAVVLTVAAFLASSSYWMEYNAHLAASQCALAGLIGVSLQRLPAVARRALIVATIVLVAWVQFPSLRQTIQAASARDGAQVRVGQSIRERVPAGDCVFAFDPVWTLSGDRLPPHGDGAPIVVDSYGLMLLDAIDDGARFADTGQAFQSAGPQRDVRARLESCRFAILGWRGRWQLNAQNRDWFFANFSCNEPRGGELCVWERMPRPFTGLAVGDGIRFGEGWYGEEGTPPNSWRWMGGRGVIELPPIAGPARLQLYFHVPEPATVAVTLGDAELERFVQPGSVVRTYDVDVQGGGTHTLVLTADRTVTPGPSDPRTLGLQLTRIIWQPRGAGASTSSTR